MVVLFLSPSIYNNQIPEFTRNKTGFGMMVRKTIESVSEFDETYLLTHVIKNETKMGKCTIVNHTWKDIITSLSMKYLFKGIFYGLKFKQKFKKRLKYIYYYLEAGYVRKIIKKLKPDVVHIHGIGYSTKSYIDVCRELAVPFVVTLHGLNGLDESVGVGKHEKNLEKEFLLLSEKENIPVTVISSGIKTRIIKNYQLNVGNNIEVIINGTDIERTNNCKLDVRSKYKIDESKKIILCVGNVTANKNQKQIVDAFRCIDEKYKNDIVILFLGNLGDEVGLQEYINELGFSKQLICCGFIEEESISSYLMQADYNIVASINEGFGLSIIESFKYGNPTVTFDDLDAIADLYDQKVMVLSNSRTNNGLALAIENMLDTNWDREYIMNYSDRFSLEKIAERYHNHYNKIRKLKVTL